MNCPGHILIYKIKLHSYRDLPVRLAELGTVYRYERSACCTASFASAALRRTTLIFSARPRKSKPNRNCLQFAFDTSPHSASTDLRRSSPRGTAARAASTREAAEQWQRADAALHEAAARLAMKVKVAPDEAAFYGPKIDVKLVDAIGRPWQLSTVQFDFNLPDRFGLEYVAEDGKDISR